MKLYTNDRFVPYKRTAINAVSTKAEIDGLLARYGIKKTAWEWDPENNKVSLMFQLSEIIHDRAIEPVVRIEPPRIWDKATRTRREAVNWNVSMRVMFWFIKSHLEMAYLYQSDKTTEFLPFIQVAPDKTVKDVIVGRLDELQQLAALPGPEKKDASRIVDSESNYVVDSEGVIHYT